MKSVTVIAEDRVALLADISYVLGMSNINIDNLNVEMIGGKAIITLSVKDPIKAKDILERNSYNTAELDAIVIKVANHLSEMTNVEAKLHKAKVHVEKLAMITSSATEGIFALTVDKPRKAMKLLGDIALVNGNSVYG
jgi:hypothetical protein